MGVKEAWESEGASSPEWALRWAMQARGRDIQEEESSQWEQKANRVRVWGRGK